MSSPVSTPATARQLLVRSFGRHKPAIIVSLLFRSLHQAGELGVPLLMGIIIDEAITTGEVDKLVLWVGILALDFLLLSLGWRFGARFEYNASQLETHLLRGEIARHILHDRGARSEQLPGELLSVATSDADRAAESIHIAGWGATGILGVGLSSVALLLIDVKIGLIVVIGLPICLALLQLLTPALTRRSRDEQDLVGKVAALASDLVRGLRPLKGVGAEDQASLRYRGASQEAMRARIHTATSFGVMFGASSFVSVIFLALIAGVGGNAAIDGTITIGQLVSIVGIVQYMSEPVTLIGEATAEFSRARTSARRVVDVLKSPRLIALGNREPEAAEGRVTIEDLEYGGLEGLTFETRPGEVLGLVLSDGAASDALMDVLSAEAEPGELGGKVLVDGVPIHDLAIAALHSRLLVSRHQVDLFEGTLRSNIGAGHGDIDLILKATSADDVAGLDPAGLDQPVTDRGATLSGGQRQRIALARALMVDVPTLILQDPTTAVDAITEQVIAAGLRSVRHSGSGRATVILTSSPSLLTTADRVLHVVEGRVVASGSHAELLHENEEYRRAVLR